MGKNIFVGNLPFSVGEEQLQELFQQKGAVDSVTVMRDSNMGRSRGFAFVNMATEEDARKAIEELNGYTLEDRKLTVNEAKPKPERRQDYSRGGPGGRRNSRR